MRGRSDLSAPPFRESTGNRTLPGGELSPDAGGAGSGGQSVGAAAGVNWPSWNNKTGEVLRIHVRIWANHAMSRKKNAVQGDEDGRSGGRGAFF